MIGCEVAAPSPWQGYVPGIYRGPGGLPPPGFPAGLSCTVSICLFRYAFYFSSVTLKSQMERKLNINIRLFHVFSLSISRGCS